MWLQICKLSFVQSKRKMKQSDQKSIVIVFAILIGFQFYLYKGLKEAITQFTQLETSQFAQLFFVFSFIMLFINFLLLNFFKNEDRSFLLRLPIINSAVFRAYYYPLILSLWILYLFEGISANIAILQFYDLHFFGFFASFFILGCLFSILLALSVKCSIEIIFSKYGKMPKIFELLCYLTFLGIYFLVCIIKPFSFIQIFWANTIFMFEPITNLLFLVLICFLLFGFIHFYISSHYSWNDFKPHKLKSRRFRSSTEYNGFLFDTLQVLRSWQLKKGILFPVVLGVAFVLIPYTMMGDAQIDEYFIFLIISIGLACVQHSAYSDKNHRALKNITIDLMKLLVGKAIFYLTLSFLLFGISLVVLHLFGVSLDLLFIIRQVIELFLFTSLALVINSMSFDQHTNTAKLLITIYSLILYFAISKGVEFISFEQLWLQSLIIIMCIGAAIVVYVLVSKKRLERSLYVPQ